MSVWKDENIADKIVEILKNIKYKNGKHNFGNPFLTTYQIAIEFKMKYPNVVNKLPNHKDIGGEGLGDYNSLSQYIGRQISEHYQEMKNLGVECGFLSSNNLVEIEFSNNVKSSVDDVSIARYIEN